jgi:hypothetical protein
VIYGRKVCAKDIDLRLENNLARPQIIATRKWRRASSLEGFKLIVLVSKVNVWR